ncbi:MAG: CRISPR system precrRNA processing endoribonuclease RAMP protein Cas6 [Chloroflexota bacterium]
MLLEGLKVYHIRVSGVAESTVRLPEDQPGMAIRGAFFNSLWQRFCTNKEARGCATCPLNQACPVSALVAPLRDENPRGRDIPRPYSIRPPLAKNSWQSGETLQFGLTLFGKVLPLLPYVALAANAMGQGGVGLPDGTTRRRGRFRVTAVEAVNLLSGSCQDLLDHQQQLHYPKLAVGAAEVEDYALSLASDTLALEFLTPLRLVNQGELVRELSFRPFFQRLIERMTALDREYSDQPTEGSRTYYELLEKATKIKLLENQTKWRDIGSYSAWQGRTTPIGGLIGRAVFHGDFTDLLSWLVWGEASQVGKDVVKGNGCYHLVSVKAHHCKSVEIHS